MGIESIKVLLNNIHESNRQHFLDKYIECVYYGLGIHSKILNRSVLLDEMNPVLSDYYTKFQKLLELPDGEVLDDKEQELTGYLCYDLAYLVHNGTLQDLSDHINDQFEEHMRCALYDDE